MTENQKDLVLATLFALREVEKEQLKDLRETREDIKEWEFIKQYGIEEWERKRALFQTLLSNRS